MGANYLQFSELESKWPRKFLEGKHVCLNYETLELTPNFIEIISLVLGSFVSLPYGKVKVTILTGL